MATAAPRLAGQLVLAVFAHPDDESLACGGTLARLADAGARVVVMCATRGERGSPDGPQRDIALGQTRARELQQAAAALGVSDLLLLDHVDGDLRWAQVADICAEIALYFRRHRPAAVITFGEDGLYWHPDHIAIHERVLMAAGAVGMDAPPVYAVTMLRGVMTEVVESATVQGWTTPTRGFWSLHPDAFGKFATPYTLDVDVADWVPRKLAAICAHRSQMGEAHPFCRLTTPDARRLLGREFFRRLALPSRADAILESLCTPTC